MEPIGRFAMPPSPDYTPLFFSGPEGEVLLRVRASPGCGKDGIRGVHGSALRVSGRAAPEKGKANEALEEVIARGLKLRRSAVRLWRGETSRDKVFQIEGLTGEELCERVREVVAPVGGA